MEIYNCCSLCLEEDKNNGDNLIWRDGLQLCESCYKEYTENEYNKEIMCVNAIKNYRRKIEELEEDTNKYQNLLYEIRNKLRYKIIAYDGINYRPIKNLTKSEVYKTFAELRDLLQADYIFKDNEEAIIEIIGGLNGKRN